MLSGQWYHGREGEAGVLCAGGVKGGTSMRRRSVITWLAGILVVVPSMIAPSASAVAPEIERVEIDEVFADEFLTEACGVDVTTSVLGHIIFRTFSGSETGLVQLNTLNIALTATAGDNTYSARDVGADLVRVEPDGTAVLSIIGQVPFEFVGILKIDLETGDAILEPQHSLEGNLDEACAALTA